MTRDDPGAVRSPELLKDGALTPWHMEHGPGPLTAAEADVVLRGVVHAWRNKMTADFRSEFGLLEYTGMTGEEMASWILTGVVPARVRRVWGLS